MAQYSVKALLFPATGRQQETGANSRAGYRPSVEGSVRIRYDDRLHLALAKNGASLYDARYMTRRIRFAYFYAYLGPARVRLGAS